MNGGCQQSWMRLGPVLGRQNQGTRVRSLCPGSQSWGSSGSHTASTAGGQAAAPPGPPSSYGTREGPVNPSAPAPGSGTQRPRVKQRQWQERTETGAGAAPPPPPGPLAGTLGAGLRPEAPPCALLAPGLHAGPCGLVHKPPTLSCSKAALFWGGQAGTPLPQGLRAQRGWRQAAGTVVESRPLRPRPPARGAHQLVLLLHLGLPVLAPLVPLLQLCNHSLTPLGQGLLVLNQLQSRAGATAAALRGPRPRDHRLPGACGGPLARRAGTPVDGAVAGGHSRGVGVGHGCGGQHPGMPWTSPSSSSHGEDAAHFHRREEARCGRPMGLEVSSRPEPGWHPITRRTQQS